MSPLLKLVQMPLDGIQDLRYVKCNTQPGASCRPAEGPLDPTVSVSDEDTKQHRSLYGSLVTNLHLDTELLTTAL